MNEENHDTSLFNFSSLNLGLSRFIRKMRERLNFQGLSKGHTPGARTPMNESFKGPRHHHAGQVTNPKTEKQNTDFDPDNDDDFVIRQ